MFARSITAPLLATAMGAAALGALPTASASSPDPGDSCLLRAQEYRVKNVQNDVSGTDQVFVRLGNSSTITRTYTPPQSRNALADGQELFSSTAQVTLYVEAGGGFIGVDTFFLPCQDGTHILTFANGDALYKVKALVQLQP